jgi:hypothetical protein
MLSGTFALTSLLLKTAVASAIPETEQTDSNVPEAALAITFCVGLVQVNHFSITCVDDFSYICDRVILVFYGMFAPRVPHVIFVSPID